MHLRALPYLVRVALLVVLYISTATLGLALDAVGGFATAVWPPTGLALAALVLGGYRLWPGITLGAFFVNALAGAPLAVAAGMAFGNTLEALVGAGLLTHVVRARPALDRLWDVLGLAGAAGLSALVSATIGVSSGWLGGVIPAATYSEAWSTWWLGDMNGALVVAALILTWSSHPKIHLSLRSFLEGASLLLAVVALSLLVFGEHLSTDLIDFSYLLFPVLIWAALRFGPPGASAATVVVSTLAIWGTARGGGPFVSGTLHESVLALQAFMSIVAATGLVLAAVVAERTRAEQQLVAHHATTRLLAEAATPGGAIPKVLQTICDSLEWEMGALWYVDPEAHILRYGESWQRPGVELAEFAAVSRSHTFGPGIGLPGRVWGSGEPAWIVDVTQDANFPRAPMAATAGLHSAFAFPLRFGTDVLGVIEFFSRERRAPDDELLQMVATVGGQLGQFLERTRAEKALREGEEHLRLALQAGQMGTWEWHVTTGQVIWSETLEAIHGLAPGTFPGTYEAYLSDIHPEDRSRVEDAVAKTLAVGSDHRITYRIVLPDGRMRWVEGRGRLFRDDTGRPLRMSGVCMDITGRMQAEHALQTSEHRFRTLTSLAPAGIFLTDAAGDCLFVNERWCEMAGMTPAEAMGSGWGRALHPEDRERVITAWYAATQDGSEFAEDYRFQTPAGHVSWIHGRAVALAGAPGNVTGYVGMVMDIGQRKLAEDQLRASLREKEVLLREVHHRVKNNLQVISSLLTLQGSFIEDPQILSIFEDCQHRIHSMALIHQRLYQAESMARIDFGAYLQALAGELLRSYAIEGDRIQLTTSAENLPLTIDAAIPCALLANELFSNCIKHAFPDGQVGHIWVTFRRVADGKLQLQVRDNGIGLPAAVNPQSVGSFGLQLVGILCEQLRASLEIKRHPGTTFTITLTEPTS